MICLHCLWAQFGEDEDADGAADVWHPATLTDRPKSCWRVLSLGLLKVACGFKSELHVVVYCGNYWGSWTRSKSRKHNLLDVVVTFVPDAGHG